MAERFAVPAANLCDTWDVSDLRPIDAALVEPLGCVVKSLRKLNPGSGEAFAVVGLGVMGLLHMLLVDGAVGYDTNPARVEWARGIGLDARSPETNHLAESVVVCPGTPAALEYGLRLAAPDSKVMLFAPMTPGPPTPVPLNDLYFRDVTLLNSYSCGPEDTRQALELLRRRSVRAEQVVSHFVELDELPEHYEFMKIGRELKPMVVFT
jgi:L-iditol 2-dehydrogenase